MGVVLTQNEHPISYFRKKLCPKLQNSSIYVHSLHAIITAVQKSRHYPHGKQFIIETDQKSLGELMNQIIQSRLNIIIFLNSLSMIMWFYINLVNRYCRGCFITQGYFSYISLLLLTTPVFYFLNTLLLQDQSLLDLQVLHLKMATNSMSHPNFMIHKGIIYYKGKTYLSKNSSLVPYFCRSLTQHKWEDIQATLKLSVVLKSTGTPCIKMAKNFVSTDITLQQTKYLQKPLMGLLQSMPPPSATWEDTSMDFIIHLPAHQNQWVILVAIDKCSKASHFHSLPTHFSASKAAEIFTQIVCKHHGTPKVSYPAVTPFLLARFEKHSFN